MKSRLLLVSLLLAVAVAGVAVYVSTQRAHVWCNRQWAGVSMHRGYYRSWSMRFCEGEQFIDGKMQPIIFVTNSAGVITTKVGYFKWPQFRHAAFDPRNLIIQGGPSQGSASP